MRLASLLGLKPAEVQRTSLASGYHFLFVAAVVLLIRPAGLFGRA